MLPVLSRFFENVIYDKLYLEWSGVLTWDQSGFRASHSKATWPCTDDRYSGMYEGL